MPREIKRAKKRCNYKIRRVEDGMIFDTIYDACDYYNKTFDQLAYRVGHIKDYKDGINLEKIWDNEEAIKSTEAIDSSKFVEKYGEKTVPVPGYEDRYTISTRGVITDIGPRNSGRVLPVRTKVKISHNVVLHKGKTTMQTHSVVNLMKKAFGDPEEQE